MEVELVGLARRAAAELVDHGQADRQIVAVKSEGARGRELGAVLDQPALRQPEQDLVGVISGKKSAMLGGCGEGHALAVLALDENAVELRPLPFAPVDAQREMLAELVELANLDSGAKRAGLEVEA